MKSSLSRDKISLSEALKKLLRRWYIFAFTIAIVVSVAYIYLRVTPKVYQLRATLLLNDPPKVNLATQPPNVSETTASITNVEDAIGLLTSFGLVREAVEDLNFQISYYSTAWLLAKEEYNDLPFRIVLDSTHRQLANVPIYIKRIDKQLYRLKIHGRNVEVFDLTTDRPIDIIQEVNIDKVLRVGQPYQEQNLSFTVTFLKTPDIYDMEGCFFVINSLAEQARRYQKKLHVHPLSEQSHILELSLKGDIPQKEADFLNKLLELYLEYDVERQNQVNRELIAFIDQQLGIAQHADNQATSRNQAVIEKQETLTKYSFANRRGTERAFVLSHIQSYEALLQRLQNSEEIITPPTALSDSTLQNLILQYNNLIREQPKPIAANETSARISKLNAQIQKTRVSLIEYTANLTNQARRQLVGLDNSIPNLGANLSHTLNPDLPALRRQLNLDENVYHNLYDYLLTRRAEAGIALATTPTHKMIVDAAGPGGSELIYPDASQIYLIAVLLGLLLPLGLMITRRFLGSKIVNQTDIQIHTPIPTLGVVGYNEKAGNYLVAYSSKSALAESFRSLRVNLQYLFLDTDKKVIGITSSQQGEGKTFCASNLSVVMAQSGKKTLLIDTDLRKPRIAARFDMDNMLGLATYLTGIHSLEDIIRTTDTENLHVITSGPSPSSPLNLLSSSRMGTLINKLRQEYDYIILDTPPLGIVSDFLVLMDYTDFNIFIIRHKLTEHTGLTKINELYNTNRLKNVGILINGARSMSAYGYSDKTYKYGYRD